jgi:hypothetical protein
MASLCDPSFLRKQLRQLLTFVPKNTSVTRRTAPQAQRGPAAAAADIENRRQAVAGAVHQLQLRERRVLHAERCVAAAYMFFTNMLQVGAQTKTLSRACTFTVCVQYKPLANDMMLLRRSCQRGSRRGARCRGRWRRR